MSENWPVAGMLKGVENELLVIPSGESRNAVLQHLPKVHTLLDSSAGQKLSEEFGRVRVREALRGAIDALRRDLLLSPEGMRAGGCDADAVFASVRRGLLADDLTRLQRVINATGIVIHTNLGRAPLAAEAIDAAGGVSQGYSNLEMDLGTGRRGARGGQTNALLCRLTGAEASLVVNNNAAAVLLALASLASDGEVILSRGEMVEIGGGYRIPEVIVQGGSTLVEVGATNKTRLTDYAQAITPQTRLLLKVHASNFRIVGFTSSVSVAELSELGRRHNLMVMEDLGSGALIDLSRYGLPPEPTVADAVRQGADVVAFSGDKLLGGPQCGILVGRRVVIERMLAHPLFRALRADKMTLAALEATLTLYEDEDRLQRIPVVRMLMQTPEELLKRARRLRRGLAGLPGISTRIQRGVGFSGGGTLPELALPTQHVAVQTHLSSVDCLAERLRRGSPPIVGTVSDGCFLMDVRTVSDTEVPEIIAAFRLAFPAA